VLCIVVVVLIVTHFSRVSKHWDNSFQQLLHYRSQLETRTKQTIDFFQAAAEGCCAIDSLGKKKRKKRRKALETMAELMSRMQDDDSLYGPIADLLQERAEMRRQWKKREEDHVFHELDRLQ
jgi:sulfur transfer protein SufE